MPSFLQFIKYNNALPIVVSLVLVGTGSAFAATDPGALYSSAQQVVTVDNTYIAAKDLSNWTPTVQITGVTEDADNYYVAYDFATIDIVDYVWRDTVKHETMTVSKAGLNGGDLGVYVTGQFKNIIANELSYLTQVQQKAREETTQKSVATTYGGLIGKMLTDTTQTLPGYTPVIQPPPVAQSAAAGATGDSSGTPSGSHSTLMSLQLLGNNPAVVPVHASYVDLGVVLLDPGDPNLGYHAFVDGKADDGVSIDTSTSSVHTVEYRATDQSGTAVLVRRIVLVGAVQDPGGEISTDGTVGEVAPTTNAAPQSSAPADSSNPRPGSGTPDASASWSVATDTSPATSTPSAATSTSDSSASASTTADTSAAATSTQLSTQEGAADDTSTTTSSTTTADTSTTTSAAAASSTAQ